MALSPDKIQKTIDPLNRIRNKFNDAWTVLEKELKEEHEHTPFSPEQKEYIREQIFGHLKIGIKKHLGRDV
jgi:hypothetical protein